MDGFLNNYKKQVHDHYSKYTPLEMWLPEKIPVMVTLAKEFALFDRFFCSHPGPTDPNRIFMHTGTSAGITETDE